MGGPFLGSEALADGLVSRAQLATGHTRLFRDVYLANGIDVTALDRARGAWLWSRRRGVIAGFSAAVVHGSNWVDVARPAELLHDNRHRQPGLLIRSDALRPDEVEHVAGMPVTTPARTAVDLACWYAIAEAVAGIDALARAAKVSDGDVDEILRRSEGRRGVVQARAALALIDAGAQSPKESWLRVLLVQAGLPRPLTQIPVYDGHWQPFAILDMGWPELRVAVEYDSDQHRTDRRQYRWDAQRHERLQRCGWTVIRVLAGDRPADIIRRVRSALGRRA